MAGDWIKMRVNLVTHPKVLAISEFLAGHPDYQEWSTMAGFVPCLGGSVEDSERDYQSSLRVTRYVTVASLLRFWGYANEHARDEFIKTLRVSDIDDIVQVPGFGAALESVEWAIYDVEQRGVSLPNFNEFNTAGGERSANAKSAAQRQKEYRDRQKALKSDVTSDVTVTRDSNRREEKRREEINTPKSPKGGVSRFEAFWSAYPNKVGKDAARKAFEKRRPDDDLLKQMLEAIAAQRSSTKWMKDGGEYIPNPSTWLNQGRWMDQASGADPAPEVGAYV